ncbi:thiamine phosphate synthase [bacterium]|nr:thiamine phosphate synthase [bacterium]
METCQIYAITPPELPDLPAFVEQLKAAHGAADGLLSVLQLRLKDVPDDAVLRAADGLLPVCEALGVAFILNDRADLAVKAGAGGVHLGEEDGRLSEARRLLGPEAIIGMSCYDSLDTAMELAEAGADYVAFGSFYPSTTKENTRRPSPLVLAQWSSQSEVPCVAIGGITAENAAILVSHGADFIATISYLWQNPALHAQYLARIIRETPVQPVQHLLTE